jgi:nicotinate-nucleotide pyrophosphorylase (carboxylating)
MIKDTHIDLLGGMANTLAKIPSDMTTHYPVIIEVRTETELDIILQQGLNKVTRVLLDNMSLEQMSACAKRCKGLIPTEASGNINLQTIRAVAQSGVDFASVGQLTHSANCVDLSMKCD